MREAGQARDGRPLPGLPQTSSPATLPTVLEPVPSVEKACNHGSLRAIREIEDAGEKGLVALLFCSKIEAASGRRLGEAMHSDDGQSTTDDGNVSLLLPR